MTRVAIIGGGIVIAKTSRQQQAASFGTEGATVHRADLLDVLARALPAGLVTLGKRCTQVRPDGDVAAARFADGSEVEAPCVRHEALVFRMEVQDRHCPAVVAAG
jgi:hypothetical protein